MIDQQSGISLESLLRGILGIVTVLAVAYALSYDRKRIDWKLIGGGLIMQVIFALAVFIYRSWEQLWNGWGRRSLN